MFPRFTPVVKHLMIINGLFFLASLLLPKSIYDQVQNYLALHYFESENFNPIGYIGYMFLHGSGWHIFMNMYSLLMFGVILEQTWGQQRFLIYYMVTGIGAGLFYTLVNYIEFSQIKYAIESYSNAPSFEHFRTIMNDDFPMFRSSVADAINQWSLDPNNPYYIKDSIDILNKCYRQLINVPTVGASGSVYGLLLAFGMLFPNMILRLILPPVPLKAKYFVMIFGAIELYQGVFSSGGGIAHMAHIGGMVVGFILIKYWKMKPYM